MTGWASSLQNIQKCYVARFCILIIDFFPVREKRRHETFISCAVQKEYPAETVPVRKIFSMPPD